MRDRSGIKCISIGHSIWQRTFGNGLGNWFIYMNYLIVFFAALTECTECTWVQLCRRNAYNRNYEIHNGRQLTARRSTNKPQSASTHFHSIHVGSIREKPSERDCFVHFVAENDKLPISVHFMHEHDVECMFAVNMRAASRIKAAQHLSCATHGSENSSRCLLNSHK